MLKYFFTIFFVFAISISSQTIDTTKIKNVVEMQAQIDSLRSTIYSLDSELQNIKKNMVEGKTDVDQIIALLNEEEVESISADTRSRRKRVDAILQAITERPGKLIFNGGATAILNSGKNVSDKYSAATGSFDFYAHTSFGKGTLLFFDLEAIGGNGLDDHFNTFNGINGDAGSTQDTQGIDRLNILEAWAEFTIFDELFTITAGKIDLTNYFDNNASANDETMQFITNDFVNSGAFAVPSNSAGFRIKTTVDNRYHIQMSFVSADNSGKDIFDNIYKSASIGYTFFPGSDFESNIRLYGFMHPLADNSTGWGVSFDEVLFGAYNIFARYGTNENKVAEYWGVKTAWSMGTRFVTKVFEQTTVLGIAYGENKSSNQILEKEKLLEIYARVQINKWTHISPHFQNIWNGAGSTEQYTIFGVRTHFNF